MYLPLESFFFFCSVVEAKKLEAQRAPRLPVLNISLLTFQALMSNHKLLEVAPPVVVCVAK